MTTKIIKEGINAITTETQGNAITQQQASQKAIQAAAIAYAINRIDYKKELNDFYNYLNN